ncbi:MAG: hypothetical protein LBC85_07060 [Fibromonadaceae bacterium]|jgi:hypothetical protein|nr:hypothetical protein [Fibromonadaceae bacterium]
MDEFWLWTVGNKKPQEINFNWNVERESYEPGLLAGLSPAVRLRPWKNDYILLFDRQVIIDSKTMTISDWSQVGENAWTTSCHDFWWSMGGGYV